MFKSILGAQPEDLGEVLAFKSPAQLGSTVTHCYISDLVRIAQIMPRHDQENLFPTLGKYDLTLGHGKGVWLYPAELVAVWHTGTCECCCSCVFTIDVASRRSLGFPTIPEGERG